MPPPLDDTQDGLRARNLAAIAKVAALLPVNANEIDLAAQCIAARAQAEDILRLLRQHAGDIQLVMRLNAQYGSMVRTSLSAHARLMRVQALRHKREAIEGAANEDARLRHVVERSMLRVVDADAARLAASARAAPVGAPVGAPAACEDQSSEDPVSQEEMNSHDAAFETWLSAQSWNQGSKESGKTGLHPDRHEATARSPLADRQPPASGRETLERAA